MRVLLLGATGNLGLRLIPTLVLHGHDLTVLVRSSAKLRSLISQTLLNRIKIYQGDILSSEALDDALSKHDIDAVINTAHNNLARPWKEFHPDNIVASVSAAAVRAGQRRGRPIRAWFIGGLGSLEYPGTGGWRIEDYMPLWMTQQHRETERVLKAIPVAELEWSILCVAMMRAEIQEQIDVLGERRAHGLVVAKRSPPGWEDHWVRWVPVMGPYLNLFPVVRGYGTKLEDVAELITGDLVESSGSEFVGELVGMKEIVKEKRV